MICLIINRKSLEEEEEGSIGDSLFETLQQQGRSFVLSVFCFYSIHISDWVIVKENRVEERYEKGSVFYLISRIVLSLLSLTRF